MNLAQPVLRFHTYFRRHGVRATVSRIVQAAIRTVSSNRMVLFYLDLTGEIPVPVNAPSLSFERKNGSGEICQRDLDELVEFWNPRIVRRQMRERFTQGASLWLAKTDGRLAAYGWSVRGGTIEPHFFGLGQDDVHLFDFYVTPSYRGRGLNPQLVNHILRNVAIENGKRAFIEAAEWNHAQLASLGKTSFRRLGYARKFTIGGRTIVFWDLHRAAKAERQSTPALPQAQ